MSGRHQHPDRELSERGSDRCLRGRDPVERQSAATLSVFVGAEGERTTLLNLARLIDEGENVTVIPVLAVTAVGKEMTRDAPLSGAGLPDLRPSWVPIW